MIKTSQITKLLEKGSIADFAGEKFYEKISIQQEDREMIEDSDLDEGRDSFESVLKIYLHLKIQNNCF